MIPLKDILWENIKDVLRENKVSLLSFIGGCVSLGFLILLQKKSKKQQTLQQEARRIQEQEELKKQAAEEEARSIQEAKRIQIGRAHV